MLQTLTSNLLSRHKMKRGDNFLFENLNWQTSSNRLRTSEFSNFGCVATKKKHIVSFQNQKLYLFGGCVETRSEQEGVVRVMTSG